MNRQVVPSTSHDLPAVFELLEAVNLPTEGVAEHFADFLIARANERVLGCVGLEKYGSHGLLRSLAVAPNCRGQGVGLQLTAQLLAYAQTNTIHTIALLTTTAAGFFIQHFGFEAVERSHFPDVFAASPEWSLPRCASAVCLTLSLP